MSKSLAKVYILNIINVESRNLIDLLSVMCQSIIHGILAQYSIYLREEEFVVLITLHTNLFLSIGWTGD